MVLDQFQAGYLTLAQMMAFHLASATGQALGQPDSNQIDLKLIQQRFIKK